MSFVENITGLVIPQNVQTVGEFALAHSNKLEKVTILASDMEVGYGVFLFCDNLKEVYVPKERLDYYKKKFAEYDFKVLSLD